MMRSVADRRSPPANRFRTVLLLSWVALLAIVALSPAVSRGAADNRVRVLEIDGAIDPIVATYLLNEIDAAESAGDTAVLVRMDTPGGLDLSMRTIIQRIMGSKVPVIVYTAPTGARAASAGALISLSAHVATMAPGTTIGAAHPVNLGGGEQGAELSKKVENDAAAFVRGIAKERGRNVKWAEDAVRESVSATAEEAKKLGVIDFIAKNDRSVLKKSDGLVVKLDGRRKKLSGLAGAELLERPMTARQRLLHGLIDPNIVFILMMLGTYGIIYEMANPGFGFAGIGGGITLILALYGLQALPLNLAGLALILLALILFVAEALTPAFGVLAGGGLIALIFGAGIMIDAPRAQLGVSGWVIAPIALMTLAFIVLVVRAAISAHRSRPVSGTSGMIGLTGKAATDIDPKGQVLVHGEVWSASSLGGKVSKGEAIIVLDIDGLRLKIEPADKREG